MNDILKEIESDLKSERYQRFFVENGAKLIVGAIVIIVITAAYTINKNIQVAKSEKLGASLIVALDNTKPEKYDEVLKEDHEAYTPIALLSKSAVLKVDEKYDEAIADLKKVAEGKFEKGFAEIAKINQAFLLIQKKGNEKEILNLLNETSQKDSPFKFTAMELKADYFITKNNIAEAKTILRELEKSEGVPQTIQARAKSNLALLN